MREIHAMPFGATQDARDSQRKSVQSRLRDPVRELSDIQRILRAKLDNEELTALEASQLTRGYVEAEKLKRVIRGQAANTSQSIKSTEPKRKKVDSTGPIEPSKEG